MSNDKIKAALSSCEGLAEIANGYFLRRMMDGPMSVDWRRTVEILSGMPPDLSIADIGCGPGTFLLELSLLGYSNLIAADIDQKKLDWCSQIFKHCGRPQPELLCGPGCSPLHGRSVDVATAFEWAYESEEFLPELLEVDARILIVSMPTQPRMIRTRVNRSVSAVVRLAMAHGWTIPEIPSWTDETIPKLVTYVLYRDR